MVKVEDSEPDELRHTKLTTRLLSSLSLATTLHLNYHTFTRAMARGVLQQPILVLTDLGLSWIESASRGFAAKGSYLFKQEQFMSTAFPSLLA